VLQCVAVCWSVLQCVGTFVNVYVDIQLLEVLECVGVCSNV